MLYFLNLEFVVLIPHYSNYYISHIFRTDKAGIGSNISIPFFPFLVAYLPPLLIDSSTSFSLQSSLSYLQQILRFLINKYFPATPYFSYTRAHQPPVEKIYPLGLTLSLRIPNLFLFLGKDYDRGWFIKIIYELIAFLSCSEGT